MICTAGSQCLARDEHGHPAAVDALLPLCFWCLEAAERDVRALVLDYRDLEQHLPRGTSRPANGMPHARHVDAQLLIDEDVEALQREIWFVADSWDAVVRDFCRLSEKPPRVRDGWSVQQSVAILAPRLDRLVQTSGTMWDYPGTSVPCPAWSSRRVRNSSTVLTLRCSQDGVRPCGTCAGTGRVAALSEVPGWQGVLDLADLHRRATGALGLAWDKGELIVGVACPRCEIRSKLHRTVDAVTCKGCKVTLETAEYAGWVLEDAARQEGEAA